jgi:DNA polymerase III gamma/tau subunit
MDLINETTKDWVEAYIDNPNVPLLLSTNFDISGGEQIANYIYKKLSESTKTPLYVLDKTDKNSIGIEEIRELLKHVSLKADNSYKYTRFILVKNADLLTVDAQNAVLKQIEELPERTIFMMVASSLDNMLPTIISRCYLIDLLPISQEQAYKYAKKNNIDNKLVEKAYSVSEGNYSIFIELLKNEDHEMYELLNTAKMFISSDVYSRQTIVKKVAIDREKIELFISSIQLIARTAMRNAETKESKIRWKNILTEVIIAKNNLEKNVQTKLVLLSLSVSI